jgi:hypothetical protein
MCLIANSELTACRFLLCTTSMLKIPCFNVYACGHSRYITLKSLEILQYMTLIVTIVIEIAMYQPRYVVQCLRIDMLFPNRSA